MERIYLWLFGISESELSDATNVSVHWMPAIPLWLIFMVIVPAIAIYTWKLYARETGFLNRVRRGFLTGLRIAAFAVLLLVLLQPVVSMDMEREVRGVVLVLVDTSGSMGVIDDQYNTQELDGLAEVTGIERTKIQKTPRIKLVQAWMKKLKLVEAVREKSDVMMFTFSSKLDRVDNLQASEANGTSTRIGDAILQGLREVRGKHINSILVVTDGRSNAGLTVDYVADSVAGRRPPIPVYTVGVGSDKPPRDVKILRASAEPVVQLDEDIVVEFEIDQTGYRSGQAAAVKLLDEAGRVLKAKEVQLKRAGFPVTGRLKVKASNKGDNHFKVKVDELPGEISPENNAQLLTVHVLDQKVKVLFIDGLARSEYLFLRSSLIRDRKLETHCWLASADPDWPQELSLELLRKGDRGLKHFPGQMSKLKDYDVVVLGDVNLRTLGDPRRPSDPAIAWNKLADNLVRYVEEGGGSIIFVAGAEYNPWKYRDTPLEKLLPIKIPTTNPLPSRIFSDEFRPRLSAHGRTDPMLRLKADEEKNVKFWEEEGGLPPLYWYTPVKETKAGARTLLTHPDGSILMATQNYGRGRTMYVGTDETWRWREYTRDRTYYQFWGTVIQRMRVGKVARDKRFQIFVRPLHILGDKVEIEAQVLDDNLEPAKLDSVRAQITSPAGETEEIGLQAVEGRPGAFSATYEPKTDGQFQILLGDPNKPKEHTIEVFKVQTPSLELKSINMDPEILGKLSAKTKGGYTPLHEAGELIADIRKGKALPPLRERKERDLWDTPLAFFLFLLFMVAEWALRKRWGLS